MPKSERRKSYTFDRPGNYCIRVIGHLDESWSERLGGLRISACSLEGSRRTGCGVSRPSARSGKTCRGVEQSLRAAPDPAVGRVSKRRLKVFRWRRIRSQEVKTFDIYRSQLDSIGISILGTRMNTDYQDNKSYKKPNLCGNL